MIFVAPISSTNDGDGYPYAPAYLVHGQVTLLQEPIEASDLPALQPKAPLGFQPPQRPAPCACPDCAPKWADHSRRVVARDREALNILTER